MNSTLRRLGFKAVVALGLGLGAWTSGANAQQGRLMWLGDEVLFVTGVSDSGLVVGVAARNNTEFAFRWSSISGLQILETPEGARSFAYGISADGQVVAGAILDILQRYQAVIWTSTGLEFLGVVAGYDESVASAVSADGSVVVGTSIVFRTLSKAFSWKQGILTGLEDLGGGISHANGVSGDGQTVVGTAYNRDFSGRPVKWKNNQVQPLSLPQPYDWGTAKAASRDGRVVVGWLERSDSLPERPRAVRWDEDAEVEFIDGDNADIWFSYAYGVSANGETVVGCAKYTEAGGYRAFRWSASEGMRDLNVAYSHLLNDSLLISADAISPNGRYIVGVGYNAATGRVEAFLLDTQSSSVEGDVDGNGCVDDADLLEVLFNFGATGQNRADVNGDSTVDDADLLEVLFNFGSGC